MKKYSWKVGGASFLVSDMDANKVGKELESLGDNITASGVVALARKKKSEMHDYFEWDDSIAGEKYREEQARKLIQLIEVTFTKDEKDIKPVRAYVNVKRCSGYSPIEDVVQDVDAYQMLLDRAYEDLRIIKNKYAELQEIQEKLSFLNDI